MFEQFGSSIIAFALAGAAIAARGTVAAPAASDAAPATDNLSKRVRIDHISSPFE